MDVFELDAYYARLYRLTRKQLRYILDPHDLTDRELADILDPTEDPADAPRTTTFPGETFRVLKNREIKEYGEFRTRRLVLAAWDRLHQPVLLPAALPAQTTLAAVDISPIDRHVALLSRILDVHQRYGFAATLGHVKAEKLSHLIEERCDVDLDRQPVRNVAGPVDFPHFLQMLTRAAAVGAFAEQARPGGKGFSFRPLGNFQEWVKRSDTIFGEQLPEIDRLILMFVGQDSDFTEIVATLYAAWNDLLASSVDPTEDDLLADFYAWSPAKAKFLPGYVRTAYLFMKQEGIVPTGRGRLTPIRNAFHPGKEG